MSTTKASLQIAQVPTVIAFMQAELDLTEFKNKNAKVIVELEQYIDAYNTALEQAEKTVKALDASCGPFDRYLERTTVDAEKLYERLGRDQFLAIGGALNTKTEYSLDKKKALALVATGQLDPELAKETIITKGSFHTPKKLSI